MSINLTDDRDARIVWACLWAQIEDVHAPVWELTADDAARAHDICESIPVDSPAEDTIVAKALSYLAYEIDHPDMTEQEVQTGERLLAELDARLNAMAAS